jgi:hypothetical protein
MAVHVLGGSFAYHQEQKNIHTASGIVKPILLPATIVDEMELRCRPLSWLSHDSGQQRQT